MVEFDLYGRLSYKEGSFNAPNGRLNMHTMKFQKLIGVTGGDVLRLVPLLKFINAYTSQSQAVGEGIEPKPAAPGSMIVLRTTAVNFLLQLSNGELGREKREKMLGLMPSFDWAAFETPSLSLPDPAEGSTDAIDPPILFISRPETKYFTIHDAAYVGKFMEVQGEDYSHEKARAYLDTVYNLKF